MTLRPSFRYFSTVVVLFSIILALAPAAQGQSTYYPATGNLSGQLGLTSIIECDNNNDSTVNPTYTIRDQNGATLGTFSVAIAKFASRHEILSSRGINLTNKIASYTISLPSNQIAKGDKLNCRTAFYRYASAAAGKPYEIAYVVPLSNGSFGPVSGIYSSIDPGLRGNVTLNYLTITNTHSQNTLTASIKVHGPDGRITHNLSVNKLKGRAQIQFPLGHTVGQTSGVYRVVPDGASNAVPYTAVLVQYNPNGRGGYNFGLPFRGLPAGCSGEPLQATTMNNGATDTYAVIANLRNTEAKPVIEIFDRGGRSLKKQTLTIPGYRQTAVYVSPVIDPLRRGNVGTFRVTCADPTDRLQVQSTSYGRTPGSTAVNWAFTSQARGSAAADKNTEVILPLNTFTGIADWIKYSHLAGAAAKIYFKLYDQAGKLKAQGDNLLKVKGSIDQDAHTLLGRNAVGSMVLSTQNDTIKYNADVLRVINRYNGSDIASIVPVSGTIRQKLSNGSFGGNPQSLARYRNKLTRVEAQRLLSVTSFGGNAAAIDKILADGLDKSVSAMLNCTSHPAAVEEEANDWLDGDDDPPGVANGAMTRDGIRRYWTTLMLRSPCGLKERMALFLHDRVASGCRTLTEGVMMQQCKAHLDLIRSRAFGNYGEFMKMMAKDFLVLKWLNGDKNVYIPNGPDPDENWFRELNELFMLGERTTFGAGLRHPLYTETPVTGDITQGALAATGWTTECVNDQFGSQCIVSFRDSRHYPGNITLWKDTPYETTGKYDATTLPALFIKKRGLDVGRYIGGAMFTAFCHDHPSQDLKNQLADLLIANDFSLKPVLGRILRSEACFSRDANKSRVKDPWTYAIGFLKSTGIPMRINELDEELLKMAGTSLNDNTRTGALLDPIDVFGYPALGFRDKDHKESEHNLAFAAEYYNMIIEAFSLVNDHFPTFDWCTLNPYTTARSDEVVEHLAKLLGANPSSSERTQYIRYLDNVYTSIGGGRYREDPSLYDGRISSFCRNRLSGVLQLMALSPNGLTH